MTQICFENFRNDVDNAPTIQTYGHAVCRWRKREKSKKIKDQQLWNQSPIILPQQIQDFCISSTSVIQWNSQGIVNKKAELLDLISKEKQDVLCIQETMLLVNFNLKNNNGLFKERHTNYRAHGGVAIFIHYTIPCKKWILNTPPQAISTKVNIGWDVTIVFMYNSRSHKICENLLSAFFH